MAVNGDRTETEDHIRYGLSFYFLPPRSTFKTYISEDYPVLIVRLPILACVNQCESLAIVGVWRILPAQNGHKPVNCGILMKIILAIGYKLANMYPRYEKGTGTMNNVMLDLETMGSGSKAAIVSIGACFFDPLTGQIGAEFEAIVDLQSAAKYGKIDAQTVIWWMNQNAEARKILSDPLACSLEDALIEFSTWISQIEDYRSRAVWGNGCTFDNVILGNAFKACQISQQWPYFGDRDVRTLVDLGRNILGIDPKKDMPFEGVVHNALDDAKHQARYVSYIYQKLAAGVALS